VQANQHVIVHNGEGMILDPGGHKVYRNVLAATLSILGKAKLKYVFLSHQDPDIVAAVNGWLMTTDAEAWASSLWARFIPHFGLDRLVQERLKPIGDGGMRLPLGGVDMLILPAHFLHSCGNFHVYDPISKILYTGDLGASLGHDYIETEDFEAHIPFMEGFHKRYMASSAALHAWVRMARTLDIETIAPQHGAMMRGPEMVGKFLDWCEQLECGIDVMKDVFQVPA
jgi:flavorubredoxin